MTDLSHRYYYYYIQVRHIYLAIYVHEVMYACLLTNNTIVASERSQYTQKEISCLDVCDSKAGRQGRVLVYIS